jgi:hypothetical protein
VIPQAPKVYTVPKTQTYENYHNYYQKIVEETKEGQGLDIPLIFDKFGKPE